MNRLPYQIKPIYEWNNFDMTAFLYDYWSSRLKDNKKNSVVYNTILDRRNALGIVGLQLAGFKRKL